MYDRARAWLRAHPRLVDSAGAMVFFVASIPYFFAVPTAWGLLYEPLDILATLTVALGLCGPVLVRRTRPALAFALVASVAAVQWAARMPVFPADMVLFPALYNTASRCGRRVSVSAAGVVVFGAALAAARGTYDGALALSQIGMTAVVAVALWVWGDSVATRRRYLAGLQERAERAEWERDTRGQIAAAAERARIAREMHDVVAHSLSVIVVQADGAGYAMDADPDQAADAIRTVSATGRHALTEMRRMLGVLRQEQGTQEYAPQPGVAQLEELVAQVRRSGLSVDLTVEGVPRELPSGMELAAYRVVQESLTNTLKHAGTSATGAGVQLRYTDDVLELRVVDDGRGAASLAGANGEGHGLIGMRERITMYGGSVHSGPRTGGGYEVLASLPLAVDGESTVHAAAGEHR